MNEAAADCLSSRHLFRHKITGDMMSEKTTVNPHNKRITIGLLTETLSHASSYPAIVASGVRTAAEKYDVNLLVIPGENLSPNPEHDQFMAQRKMLFDLVSAENLDGLIIMGFLGNFGPPQELADFHRHYQPLP